MIRIIISIKNIRHERKEKGELLLNPSCLYEVTFIKLCRPSRVRYGDKSPPKSRPG